MTAGARGALRAAVAAAGFACGMLLARRLLDALLGPVHDR